MSANDVTEFALFTFSIKMITLLFSDPSLLALNLPLFLFDCDHFQDLNNKSHHPDLYPLGLDWNLTFTWSLLFQQCEATYVNKMAKIRQETESALQEVSCCARNLNLYHALGTFLTQCLFCNAACVKWNTC